MSVNQPENANEGLPPFIKSWPQMYAIVIGTLFVLMLLFYVMMRYFA
jgi:antibiotic biosynthesis monooxygenase (ABM) superfamily enzyme